MTPASVSTVWKVVAPAGEAGALGGHALGDEVVAHRLGAQAGQRLVERRPEIGHRVLDARRHFEADLAVD